MTPMLPASVVNTHLFGTDLKCARRAALAVRRSKWFVRSVHVVATHHTTLSAMAGILQESFAQLMLVEGRSPVEIANECLVKAQAGAGLFMDFELQLLPALYINDLIAYHASNCSDCVLAVGLPPGFSLFTLSHVLASRLREVAAGLPHESASAVVEWM
ncbi:MAG: hypothetical protein HY821_07060 [Acidobacteria bacterium]|nr:hypothetical protein [Acidobacteriota bacterium]